MGVGMGLLGRGVTDVVISVSSGLVLWATWLAMIDEYIRSIE